ncbi:MAG: hydrogenase maturation protease [Armatimonadota bacterium]|nr:MAG: hydrogenase maturation protease [Armatimonadota bacterium]
MCGTLLVIGYGNTLRQDDGFGWRVAERLLQEPMEGVQVIACHQLTPELAEPLSRCRAVVFVDAREGEPVGKMEWETVTAPSSPNASFTHSAGPADLCLLAQALYGSAPAQASLLTVRSVHFEHGEELSPAVQEAVERAIAAIQCFALRVASGESSRSLSLEGDRLSDNHDA